MRSAWAPCVLALLTLTGCAQKWEKAGASEGDFKVAKIRCEAAGLERHPPRLQWMRLSEGYVQRGYRNCRKGRCEYTPDRHVPRRLRDRHATITHQRHSLKLELAAERPSLSHASPPVPV